MLSVRPSVAVVSARLGVRLDPLGCRSSGSAAHALVHDTHTVAKHAASMGSREQCVVCQLRPHGGMQGNYAGRP